MTPGARRLAVLALLAGGALLLFTIGGGRGLGEVRWGLLVAAVGVGAIPSVRRRVCAVLERVRHPSAGTRERTALLVGVLASAYFTFTAFHQDRDLFPKTHDEGSYLLGMQMLASGRLWMPQHELADFFDTFYVITKPVYASLYFPGTALMYAPTVWTGWPTWVLPIVASGAIVGLLYRIVTQLIDGAAGLLAAILLASLSWFRMLTILLLSQVPMLLLGMLMVWAWLRWRERRAMGWLIAIGVFAGWAAITRPVDALCYAVPIGLAIALDMKARGRARLPPSRSQSANDGSADFGELDSTELIELSRVGASPSPARSRATIATWAVTAVALVAGAAPFLALQLAFNKGVTGSILQTPYTFYLQRDQPQTSFGFHTFDASLVPQSQLAQKRDYYRTFMQPMIERHRPDKLLANWIGRDDPNRRSYERRRLAMVIDTTMPFRVLLPLACVGLLGLTTLPRWILFLPLPLLIIGYLPNTFFLEHYVAVAAPAMILAVLLSGEVLASAWPRFADAIRSSFVLGLVTLALLSTYELNPVATLLDRDEEARRRHVIDDETFPSTTLRFVHTQLPTLVQKPAVVLFRYTPADNVIEEPVYNNAAAWPDDQAIVKAHDLGDRNVEIVRYYAQRQPERTFYRFDRSTGTLTRLGTARGLLTELTAAGGR